MNRISWQAYEAVCLVSSIVCLFLAIFLTNIPLMHNTQSHMIYVDVTQSMNAKDMQILGRSVSRLEYTKHILKGAIKKLPCGTKIGIGVFFRANFVHLYNPIEVCRNYDVILDTIDHIEWRMASQGSSNILLAIRELQDSYLLQDSSGWADKIVLITDGDEAPPLNPLTNVSLSEWQGDPGHLIVGVGNDRAVPIPKLNSKNEIIGYWSTHSIKIAPASRVNEGTNNVRDDSLASEPYEYYLSKLDEPHLKEIAKDIQANYLKLGNEEALANAILNQVSLFSRLVSKFSLNGIFAAFACLFILATYIPDVISRTKRL